jgi:hypothetical protein
MQKFTEKRDELVSMKQTKKESFLQNRKLITEIEEKQEAVTTINQ